MRLFHNEDNSLAEYYFHEGTNFCAYEYFGSHIVDDYCIFRVWAPKAYDVYVTGDFNNWEKYSHKAYRITEGGIFGALWEMGVLALVVALLERFALVIFVLTACQTYHQFGQALFVDEQTGGHDGETGVLHCLLQLAQLLALEQQLAVAPCRVVVVRAIEIFGHVHILHPQFVAYEYAVAIDKAHLGEAYGLYLGTCEHNAGSVGIGYDIVERGTFVLYVYVVYFLFHKNCGYPKLDDSPDINTPIMKGTTSTSADTAMVYVKRRSSGMRISTAAPFHTIFMV